METPKTPPGRFGTFTVIWLGQVVSILGSGLTGFALGVWVYQSTGSVTRFALISLFTALPGILLSPLMGALVDRWDRRQIMIWSDAAAAVCTLGIVLLLWLQRLEVWHIYILMGASSVFRAVQWPAFTASTTLLVPRRHYGRASGMTQLGEAVAQILAPVLAGMLMVSIGMTGVILLDIASFLFAAATLLFVRIPQPSEPRRRGRQGTLREEIAEGWAYLRQRPGLMALLFMFAGTNFTVGMLQVLITPLVLSFSNAQVLGRVMSVAASGLLVGGVLMSVWGGPRRRMTGIYSFLLLQGLILFLGGFEASATLIAGAAFVFFFGAPIINGCSQAVWQAKVAPEIQGRVFSLRRMVATSSLPLAYLVGGPLADRVFEPLLAPGGALAGSVGALIGTGQGRGVALMFLLLGVWTVAMVLLGYRYRPLRHVEEDLRDHAEGEEPAAAPGPVVSEGVG